MTQKLNQLFPFAQAEVINNHSLRLSKYLLLVIDYYKMIKDDSDNDDLFPSIKTNWKA